MIVVENAWTALIDRDLYQRAQEALARQSKQTSPKSPGERRHLFTRLLVCGGCGGFMVGNTKAGRRYYLCSSYCRKEKAACDHNTVWEDTLLDQVVGAVQREYLNPENLALLRAEMLRQAEEARKSGEEDRLRWRIVALDQDIERGGRNLLLADPALIPSLSATLGQWRSEREQAAQALKELDNSQQEIEEEVRGAERQLWVLREAITTADPDLLRAVLHELIERVALHFDHEQRGTRRVRILRRGLIYLRGPDVGSYSGTS